VGSEGRWAAVQHYKGSMKSVIALGIRDWRIRIEDGVGGETSVVLQERGDTVAWAVYRSIEKKDDMLSWYVFLGNRTRAVHGQSL
jgi:hypothetical protein